MLLTISTICEWNTILKVFFTYLWALKTQRYLAVLHFRHNDALLSGNPLQQPLLSIIATNLKVKRKSTAESIETQWKKLLWSFWLSDVMQSSCHQLMRTKSFSFPWQSSFLSDVKMKFWSRKRIRIIYIHINKEWLRKHSWKVNAIC